MSATFAKVLFRSGLLLGWACVGCGNDDSGAANTDDFVAQLCAEFSDCCKAAGRPSDGAQCRALYGALAAGAKYDAASGNACLSEVRALGAGKCDATSMSTPSCRKVLSTSSSGSKKPGEACDNDDDCASSDQGEVECVSNYQNGTTTQQCQVRIVGQKGSSPCVGTVDGKVTFYSGSQNTVPTTGYLCHVSDGLTCDSTSGACEALGAVGEACTGNSYQCVNSAYCSTERKCADRIAVGSACPGGDSCAVGAYCEGDSKTCTAQGATGAACSMNEECVSDRCVNQKCDANDDLSLAFLCGGG